MFISVRRFQLTSPSEISFVPTMRELWLFKPITGNGIQCFLRVRHVLSPPDCDGLHLLEYLMEDFVKVAHPHQADT